MSYVMDAGENTSEKTSTVKTVEEKTATRAERPRSFLTITTDTVVSANANTYQDQVGKSVFQTAYRKWATSNPVCDCASEHGNPNVKLENRDIFGKVLSVSYYKPQCDRDKSWWLWVKVRDGKPVTPDDLAYLGFM